MIKRIAVLTRRPEISRKEFAKHWRQVHGELSRRVPNMLRYVQNLVTGEAPHPHLPGGVSGIDGFAEIWFKDRETLEAALVTLRKSQRNQHGRGLRKGQEGDATGCLTPKISIAHAAY